MQTMIPGSAQRIEQPYASYKIKEAPIKPWKKPNPSYKVLDSRIEKFDGMLQQFVEFVKKYKREPETFDHDDEQIYNWAQSARRKKRQGDLLPLFEDKLNNIQFVWEKPLVHVSPFLYKVERKIKSAIPFQRNHATFRWLAREVKRYNNNTKPPAAWMKFERILQINQATALEGGTVNEMWNKNYKTVLKYKKDERNQGFTELFNRKPSLEVWMNLLNLHEKLGVLNEEWVQKLADMQFHQVINKSLAGMTDEKWTTFILDLQNDLKTNGRQAKISEMRTYRKYKSLQNAYDGFASPGQKAMFDLLEIKPSKNKNWDERYDDLKKYVAVNGCMPTSKKDYNLYQWLKSTIRLASANNLSPEKYERLKDLRVEFDLGDEFDLLKTKHTRLYINWDKRYLDLKTFIEVNGCMPTLQKDSNLYLWLKSMIRNASANKLPPEKYERLKDLGVEFDLLKAKQTRLDKNWDKKYLDLKTFVEVNGCMPTIRKNYNLYLWLKSMIRKASANELPASGYELLKDLGVQFDLLKAKQTRLEKNWDKKYRLLKTFIEVNGCMPTQGKDNNLYCWLRGTVRDASANKLSAEKYERMKDLGVQFDSLENTTTRLD